MADPLSATASVITVIALCAKCTKGLHSRLQSLCNGPSELMAINNELNDLSIIFEDIKEALSIMKESSAGSAKSIKLLSQQLEKAESLLKELEAVIEDTRVSKRKTQSERLTWLRKKGKIEGLQKAIKDNKSNLRMVLATSTL